MTKQLEFLTANPIESSWHPVYIVAIVWHYVVFMTAGSAPGFISGAITLLCYGTFPLAVLLWMLGTPQRRRKAASGHAADEKPDQRD